MSLTLGDSDAIAVAPSADTPVRRREGTLDIIRAIATVRVVLWHTFAAPILSFFVASMPTMFFVAGSLLAASLDRRTARQVIADRMRRLLPPFWAFGAFVVAVLTLASVRLPGPSTHIELRNLFAWLFPLVAPTGTPWEGGWLIQPLWYLRTLIWLILLAPALRWLLHRVGPVLLSIPVAAVFVVDHFVHNPTSAPASFGHVRWFAGDLSLYSIFLMLGFMHRMGMFVNVSRRVRTECLVIASCLAVMWCWTQPLPGGVVNNSYPAHLLVGSAWLLAALRFESLLDTASGSALLRPFITVLNQRALTIYLWHTTSIIVATWIVAQLAPGAPRIVVLIPLVVVIAAFILLFGWLEDTAARRAPRIWPLPLRFGRPTWLPSSERVTRLRPWANGVAIGSAMAMTAVIIGASNTPTVATTGAQSSSGTGKAAVTATGGATGATTATKKAPAPSARPDLATFGPSTSVPGGNGASTSSAAAAPTTPSTETSPPGVHRAVSADLAGKLSAATEQWRTELKIAGVDIGLEQSSGDRWIAGFGANPTTGISIDPAVPIPITSVTKTFTAALALQLVGEGKMSLDDPIPPLAVLPDFPYAGKLTLRQLLSHTSGLDSYQSTPEYIADPAMNVDPALAVQMSGTRPLLWPAGTAVGYSSSGYLLTGLLEEQRTKSSYGEELTKRFLSPLGLKSTTLNDDATPGWVGWSTGGLYSTPEDLLTWGTMLYRDQKVLGPQLTKDMLNIDNSFSVGLGAWPVCPCSVGPKGEKIVASIGHNGGSGALQFSPSDNVVITAWLTESIFDRITQQDLYELFATLRKILAAG